MTADPLERVLHSITFTDTEVRRLLHYAEADAAQILSGLAGKEGVGAAVRATQVRLAQAQVRLWAGVKDATAVGIGDAVWQATESQSMFDEQMFAKVGGMPTYWRQSMLQSSKAGIEALTSRKQNGITLSEKVYKAQAWSQGKIEDAINSGLALGKSVREISQSVKGLINPLTPGGVSYAANRLARTEVNNAYHTTALNRYKQTPWVEYVIWNLSGSHPRPDACNDYADQSHVKGRNEAGIWDPGEVPGKPHPNCFCYITPLVMDLDEYAKAFKAGKFDNYIQKQMGCIHSA